MSRDRAADSAIVAGIVAGLKRAEISEQAGISERTLRRRLRDPHVIKEVAEARVQLHGEVTGRLQTLACRAIEQIESVLDNGNHRDRLAASKLILDQIVSHRAALDEARVSALEIAQAQDRARWEALR